jgi:undecaprenyl-diphosphatase
MILGLERKAAAEFSFLIAVPILFVASGYELLKMRDQIVADDAISLTIGFVISFVVALLAIKVFVSYLSRGKLAPFAWYRIVVAPIFYFLTRGAAL